MQRRQVGLFDVINEVCSRDNASVTTINKVRQYLGQLGQLTLKNLAAIWDSCDLERLKQAHVFFARCFSTVRFQKGLTVADAPSIARLLLLYVSCPSVIKDE